MLDRRAQRDELLCERYEVGRYREHAILRLPDHDRQMRGGQSRVERVADQPHAHRGIIEFEVMLRIPRQRPDPVPLDQPERQERARHAVAAIAQRRIVDPRRSPHDLAVAAPFGGVVEKLVHRQAIRLHTHHTRKKVAARPFDPAAKELRRP